MIDLAPYSVEEVEKHLYQTYRVEFEDLPDEMKQAVGRLAHEAAEEYDSYWSKTATPQDALEKRLADFNTHRAQKYTNTIIAEAKVCGRVNSKDRYDYDIWVEFTGITQKEFDRLPPEIQVQLYDKHMAGYASFRERTRSHPEQALKTIQDTISTALSSFVGHKITPKLLDMVKHSLKNTGLVDEVEGPFKEDNGQDYFAIKIDKGYEIINLKVLLSIGH